ncbi:uncharacterized protein LOC110980380 [Acanthaster planci]|uniref:Uncharacterized protein LOC110980380 n=1 Tax=Acanthaster planci TaxID=133434 RepID=A0A8B7YHH0_ACAPL|nr:uncharacterized protein LOC110980380 [Acanthaster planci]
MNLDLRCLSAGLVLLVILGVSWAVPLDLYDPDEWHQNEAQEEVKRDRWTYPAVPPRETRGRKNWRSNPYKMLNLVDDSVKTFDSRIMLCGKDQVCKQAEKRTFRCRCPIYTFCVADGRQYDATCKYSQVGLVYNQPKW